MEEEELLEEEPEEEPLSEAQELIETIIAAIRQIDANFFIVITFPFMRTHTAFSFFLLLLVCVLYRLPLRSRINKG